MKEIFTIVRILISADLTLENCTKDYIRCTGQQTFGYAVPHRPERSHLRVKGTDIKFIYYDRA